MISLSLVVCALATKPTHKLIDDTNIVWPCTKDGVMENEGADKEFCIEDITKITVKWAHYKDEDGNLIPEYGDAHHTKKFLVNVVEHADGYLSWPTCGKKFDELFQKL